VIHESHQGLRQLVDGDSGPLMRVTVRPPAMDACRSALASEGVHGGVSTEGYEAVLQLRGCRAAHASERAIALSAREIRVNRVRGKSRYPVHLEVGEVRSKGHGIK
jgi:hypothetical protein